MIDRIDHIVMNCRDVEATASWYERALGFEREAYQSPAEPGQRIALKFGRQKFNLRRTGSPGWATCKVDVPGSLDLCFITEGSLKPSETARAPGLWRRLSGAKRADLQGAVSGCRRSLPPDHNGVGFSRGRAPSALCRPPPEMARLTSRTGCDRKAKGPV
jgi:Glyoxalase/Bleomycin resistance protein/Dioxygenase superfamily